MAQLLCRDSIYTLKLRRRGVHFETRANTALLRRLTVQRVMQPRCTLVYDDTPLQEVMQKAVDMELADFIVVNHAQKYYGLLVARDLRTALLQPESVPLLVAGELARTNIPTVLPDETLDTILDKFARLDVNSLPVQSSHDEHTFVGMITRTALMRRYQQELEKVR
ncbi:MAG: putative voltage-gated ClC-type chloride channel ClcB [Planctomycetes bacterium ADurb.Bin412]|nr:MAG: putative voltage-gated ClC-type chloride channel ClcB [Planctomycetes bacterium ADurb.Bin412]